MERNLNFSLSLLINPGIKKLLILSSRTYRTRQFVFVKPDLPSKVETNYTLKDIFYQSKAKYKLWFKDQFVVFSPETFIKTKGRKISSFPMKGTIDA